MKAQLLACVGLTVLAVVMAECPNACSGHGFCSTVRDFCECHRNWQGADCSQRTCPHGISFVDNPVGDLNFNGDRNDAVVLRGDDDSEIPSWSYEAWEFHASQVFQSEPASYPDVPHPSDARKVANGEGHFYTECSNKGLCDRTTGQCVCFTGYGGVACSRTLCPNSCSGHGVCRTNEELGADADYALWDARKHTACECDRGFAGHDCSKRMCPRGADPLTSPTNVYEEQTLSLSCAAPGMSATFRLRYVDEFGFTWTSRPVTVRAASVEEEPALGWSTEAAAEELRAKLAGLPNNVLTGVTVSAQVPGSDFGTDFKVTFPRTGEVAELEVVDFESTCGIDAPAAFTEAVAGHSEHLLECAGRGLCDQTSGLCKCFRGYTGNDCSQQNALAE